VLTPGGRKPRFMDSDTLLRRVAAVPVTDTLSIACLTCTPWLTEDLFRSMLHSRYRSHYILYYFHSVSIVCATVCPEVPQFSPVSSLKLYLLSAASNYIHNWGTHSATGVGLGRGILPRRPTKRLSFSAAESHNSYSFFRSPRV